MRSSLKIAVVLSAAAVLVGSASPPAAVFAYSPNLLLDFSRSVEIYAGVQKSRLSDCTHENIKCVAGNVVRVAWREQCLQRVGDTVSVGGIVSTVRDVFIERRHIDAAQVAIVTTSDRPDTAFLIQEGGLMGVIVDLTKSGRLAEQIADGTVRGAVQTSEPRSAFGVVNRLLTLDPLGNCHRAVSG